MGCSNLLLCTETYLKLILLRKLPHSGACFDEHWSIKYALISTVVQEAIGIFEMLWCNQGFVRVAKNCVVIYTSNLWLITQIPTKHDYNSKSGTNHHLAKSWPAHLFPLNLILIYTVHSHCLCADKKTCLNGLKITYENFQMIAASWVWGAVGCCVWWAVWW